VPQGPRRDVKPGAASAPRDWREFRPAIWIAILGLILVLTVSLPIGLGILGAAIGTGLRIQRRRLARGRGPRPAHRNRTGGRPS
jgi:hypothetical protein